MWSTINDVLGRNRSGKKSMLFVIDGVIITDDRIIAESFNGYFSNIGGKLANKIPRSNEEHYFQYVNSIDNKRGKIGVLCIDMEVSGILFENSFRSVFMRSR